MRLYSTLLRCGMTFLLLTSAVSCMKEDLSDCPSPVIPEPVPVENLIRLSYIPYSPETGEGFEASEVESLSVFAFDSLGRFVNRVDDLTPRLEDSDYTVSMNLLPGRYDFYIWGNVETEDCYSFDCKSFVEGTTLADGIGLQYSHPANDTVSIAPGHLFFGMLDDAQVVSAETRSEFTIHEFIIPLVRDTYHLTLEMEGLKESSRHKYDVLITDANASYAFNNSFIPCRELCYTTAFDWNEEKKIFTAETRTLRLERKRKVPFQLRDCNSGQVVYDDDLIELILATEKKSGKKIDFSRMYDFTLHLIFSENEETGKISLTVRINDWNVVEKEVVIDLGNPNLPWK